MTFSLRISPCQTQSYDTPMEILVAYFLCLSLVRLLGFSRRNPDYITRSNSPIVAGPRVALRQPGYAANISTSFCMCIATRFFHATSSGAASLSHVLRCGITITAYLMVSHDSSFESEGTARPNEYLTPVIFGSHSLQGNFRQIETLRSQSRE